MFHRPRSLPFATSTCVAVAVLATGLPAAKAIADYHPAMTASPATAASTDGPPGALTEGDVGDNVHDLQARLRALRYDVGAVNGWFGSDTAHAVTAFQKAQGLPPTSVVDDATSAALAHPRQPLARHRSPGAAIEVDLTRQVLLLVVDGHVDRILDTSTGSGARYIDSTGRVARAITPRGHFHVLTVDFGWVLAPLGRLYDPASFTATGIAVHGADVVPPKPASHGCARVTVAAMRRLFLQLTLGMPVWVY
jgi:N-acetylmuramoyl-L-alanine amidase